MTKIISVYGSSAPQPGSADYEQARQLGQLLAEAGFTVQSGGYGGIMAGVSQGAAEADGQAIGITCQEIEDFRPIPANQWVSTEIKYTTLNERVDHLVSRCDGAIVLPGGIGTLAELATMWSLLQVGAIPPRPFIAVGGLWARTMNAFITDEYFKVEGHGLLEVVHTPKEAVAALLRWFEVRK